MAWLFTCRDQPGSWQGGIRSTPGTSSQRNSISQGVRAELCTPRAAVVRPHVSALRGGKSQYPLIFPLYQETPHARTPLISASAGREGAKRPVWF